MRQKGAVRLNNVKRKGKSESLQNCANANDNWLKLKLHSLPNNASSGIKPACGSHRQPVCLGAWIALPKEEDNMNTKHQIKPEDLLEMVMGYEFQTPVTFSEFAETFALYRELTPTQVTDRSGKSLGDVDLTAATSLLQSLEEAGYVIMRNVEEKVVPVREKSVYELAVADGFKGTEEDWMKHVTSLIKSGRKQYVLLTTNYGQIKIELDGEKAPITVANFLTYVREGFYNGLLFHRVIDGFMIQGGGMYNDKGSLVVKSSSRKPIENEAKNMLRNDKYTIAMARTSNPHAATSQFFINVKNNDFLNYPGQDGWGYAVFGKVVEGTDVVDKIKAVKTTRVGMYADVPAEPVIIEKAEEV